ncbi:MAG: SpoIIE family protein phosphatase [Spirochaetales bacterium]
MIRKRYAIFIVCIYFLAFLFALFLTIVFNDDTMGIIRLFSWEGFGVETTSVENIVFFIVSGVTLFSLSFVAARKCTDIYLANIKTKESAGRETTLFMDFINDVASVFSVDELVQLLQKHLENKADCSVLLIDIEKKYVVYNSPTNIASDEKTFEKIQRNFTQSWQEGFYFFDDDLGVASDAQNARGFFVIFAGFQLFIFCNYTKLVAPFVFPLFFEKLKNFGNSEAPVRQIREADQLAQEWATVAETQRSFLPTVLPTVKHLDMAEYFRPLVNVSGDYYTAIPLSESETLILLGDVSGKGFSAALIMGIVINMVKNIDNKKDLPKMVRIIDKAIKSMHFQDKYTVLFVGIIDTQKMELSYVNASMSDPLILTKADGGFKMKKLQSNCGIVGLIDLDDVEVSTMPLSWDDVILLASDGISEVMDDQGVELGNTQLYIDKLKEFAPLNAHNFIRRITDLAISYCGGKKFKDDITMLVIKVYE